MDAPFLRYGMQIGVLQKKCTVKPQVDNGGIQMITPTQADVERAKMNLKRKLQEVAIHKPKHIRCSVGFQS